MKALRFTCAIAVFFTQAACGGGVPSDPNYFTFRLEDGLLSGVYDPEGYSRNEVQRLVGSACKSKKLATYGEGPAEDGRLAFSATCEGEAEVYSAHFRVDRDANGKTVVEGVGSS